MRGSSVGGKALLIGEENKQIGSSLQEGCANLNNCSMQQWQAEKHIKLYDMPNDEVSFHVSQKIWLGRRN